MRSETRDSAEESSEGESDSQEVKTEDMVSINKGSQEVHSEVMATVNIHRKYTVRSWESK